MTIGLHIQRPNLGAEVFLYQLDLTVFGLGFLYLTPGTLGSTAVIFDGQTYSPHPIEAEGFEINTSGPLPRPTLTVANLDGSFTALVENNDDLMGAILTRIRTYERFLDGGVEPDPNAIKPPDVFLLSRKVAHDDDQIGWELTAQMDQEGVELPGRLVVRDYCGHEYRRWTGSAFDYTNVTCPYVAAVYFDENGVSTTAANDRCSKRLGTGCRARFGTTAPLPTRAFPGVARLSVR